MAEIDELRAQVENDRIKIGNLEAQLGIRKQTAAEKLASIENLPLADLKASKALLLEEAGALPASDLAARYIQARTDAKQRDQRMGEMGVEITQKDARIAELEAELAKYAEKG